MSSNLSDSIRYFILQVYYGLKEKAYYRLSFFCWILQGAFSLFLNLVIVTVIYSVSSGIPGWSYLQLLFLTYLANFTFGMVYFAANPNMIASSLRRGQFDAYLTKPYGTLTIITANNLATTPLFGIASVNLVPLVYIALNLRVSPLPLIGFLALYAAGTIALVMFLIMLGVLSYKLIKSSSFTRNTVSLLNQVAKYPFNIYGLPALLLLTLLVPLGIASYYPARILAQSIELPYYLLLMLIALASTFISYKLFNRFMRSYESGGG